MIKWIYDSEPVIFPKGLRKYQITCCHCKLTHDVRFQILGDRIIQWVKKNKRQTTAHRKKYGISGM